ncbi:MAG TPA: HlyD family secretion protein [Candidatus Acidoferrales bacterium]|nr:HlyD family secretion protein [Candidatus Acidoferrales bacterium]
MDTREAQHGSAGQTHPNGSTENVPTIEERRGPRRRVIFGILGAIVAIVVLYFGVKWFLYARVHEGTDDAYVDANSVAVTSKINERIDHLLVDTNDEVHKGELLVVLDDAVERDQVRNAQAQYDLALANQRTTTEQGQGGVAQAEAQSAGAQAGVAQAAAQLRSALAQVPAAQANYSKANADYQRTLSLVSTGDVARQDLDAERAALAAAAAQLRSAHDQVNVADANLTASEHQVAAASGAITTAQGKLAQSADPSQVASAAAQLSIAKKNLAYTHIYSPINGFVGQKSAEVGQTVSAGLTILTLIPDGPGQIYITANYKETQMGNMHVGQPVDIHVDAYGGTTFHGHVLSINPASQNTYALVPAQNATGNFVKVTQRIPVRISIDDPQPGKPLRPGMSVETYVKVH